MPATWAEKPAKDFMITSDSTTLKNQLKMMEIELTENINQKIKNYILQSVNLPDIDADIDLFEVGIVNSLFAIQLVTFLENEFDIQITVEDLDLQNFKSVNSMEEFVKSKKAA